MLAGSIAFLRSSRAHGLTVPYVVVPTMPGARLAVVGVGGELDRVRQPPPRRRECSEARRSAL